MAAHPPHPPLHPLPHPLTTPPTPQVTEGKQAADLGVKVGWKIVSVDGVGVVTAEDFDNEIEDAKKSDHGSKEVNGGGGG